MMLKMHCEQQVDQVMDMLDFEAEDLYFDEPLGVETRQCIESAADGYGDNESEHELLRAYFLEPQHPIVLVALYRFYYYQHSYESALLVADRVLKLFACRLNLPENWQALGSSDFDANELSSITELRFYLLALKGAGYLELRLGRHESAIERLKKIIEIDDQDRLGVVSLLQIAEDEVNRRAGIYRLRTN